MFSSKSWVVRGALLAAVFPLVMVGCHGRHGGRHGMNEAELREHAHDVAAFALNRVDASAAQEARIEEILDPLVPQLVALRPERQALLAELRHALRADRVDAQRIEEIRKKGLNLADRASARAAQALVEAAQVLDQSQRAELLDYVQRRHGS